MKKYVLFFFFVFQLCIYAQQKTIQPVNFEKKIIALEINLNNPEEKTQLLNSSCPDNNVTILVSSDDLVFNPAVIFINQLRNLDVSKKIKIDYEIFSYNQLTVGDAENE